MVQLRWKDETIWKDAPWLRSTEQGEEQMAASRSWARASGSSGPPACGAEFREIPDMKDHDD